MSKYISFLGAILLLLALFQPVAAAPASAAIIGYHVVQAGETLFCIARA